MSARDIWFYIQINYINDTLMPVYISLIHNLSFLIQIVIATFVLTFCFFIERQSSALASNKIPHK